MTPNGKTRVCKRTYHTLADATIRIFESVIDKMIELSSKEGKKTLCLECFRAALKLMPTNTMPSNMQTDWSSVVDEMIGKSQNLVVEFEKNRDKDDDEEEDEEEEDQEDLEDEWKKGTVNGWLRYKGYYVRATALVALTRAKLPNKWRLSGNIELIFAFGVFCSMITETILDKAGDHIVKGGENPELKRRNLAPKHIAKGIRDLTGLSHILGDSVIIGTPISHHPDLAKIVKVKRHRRRVASDDDDDDDDDDDADDDDDDSSDSSVSSSSASSRSPSPKRRKMGR